MAWKNHKARREARVTSVHEAGHAVIAAHFRIPFNDVSAILARTQIPAPYLTLQNLSRSAAMDFIRHSAVMLCASRAAVDEILPGQGEEFNYKGDENDLEEVASILGIKRSQFWAWRDDVLGEARRLVAQSDIRATITAVAQELNKPFTGKITAKEVEAMLKSACVASQEAEAHAKLTRRRTMPTYKELIEYSERLQRGSDEPKAKREPRRCPICGAPLTGRQKTACSNRCHVALHRKHRREGALPKGGKIGPQTPLPITPVDDASRDADAKRCRDAIARFAGGSGDSRDGDADAPSSRSDL